MDELLLEQMTKWANRAIRKREELEKLLSQRSESLPKLGESCL